MSKLLELQRAAQQPKIPRKKAESRAKPSKPRFRIRVAEEPLDLPCLPANAVSIAELEWSLCRTLCFLAQEAANRYGLYTKSWSYAGEASVHRVATGWNYRLSSTEMSAAMVEGYLRWLRGEENEPQLVMLCQESHG